MRNITVLFLILGLNIFAQDPIFTNTNQSLIHLNPSFSGSNGLFRFQSNTRSQWYNLSGSYLTFYNSVDVFIKPLNGGIALTYTRDDQAKGTLVTDRIDLTYAQHFNFFEKKLKIIPSLQISCFQKALDNSKLSYGDQIDPRRGFAWSQVPNNSITKKANIDLSAGLIINYKHFYIGTSVFHITQPDEGVSGPNKLPYRLSMFTSYNLPLGDKVLLNALFRFEKQQNFYTTHFNINALLFKHMILSAGINDNNSINMLAGYRHNYFTISGGYEFGISKINVNSAGSFEIAGSFNLRNKTDRKLVKDFERW
jgi:type IX secretion system PorP/SprF family membrane protein